MSARAAAVSDRRSAALYGRADATIRPSWYAWPPANVMRLGAQLPAAPGIRNSIASSSGALPVPSHSGHCFDSLPVLGCFSRPLPPHVWHASSSSSAGVPAAAAARSHASERLGFTYLRAIPGSFGGASGG